MDFVNIVYRYVNRFINSEELTNHLENIDKNKFSKEEVKQLEQLLEELKIIIETVPIEIDEVETNRINTRNHLLETLEKIKTNEKTEEDLKKFATEKYESLLKDKKKIRDSGPRYEKIYDVLVNNSVYIDYCENMTDLELLEFITQYISAPITPNIDQETFDCLVNVAIKEDKREALWRLAFNYNHKEKNFEKIENYFIEKRDEYYLIELISAVREDLDMDKLVDKVLKTQDKKFIFGCGNRAQKLDLFSDEEIERIKEKLKKLNLI